MLERIEFDEIEEKGLRRAARWMFAAGVASVVMTAPDGDSICDLVYGLAFLAIGVTVLIAAWSIRAMAVTDGRDQAHLGRAMKHLRVALVVRLVLVSLAVLGLSAAPFIWGMTAILSWLT